MKTKEITVNGYKFTVEPTLSDDNCYRLSYGSSVVLDDSAWHKIINISALAITVKAILCEN